MWHESQKITKLSDRRPGFTFRVTGLDEIKRWVLSFGSEAVVLESAKLREMVRKDLQSAQANYPARGIALNLVRETRAI
ncbi:MAG: WYL domain-containing protein [Proteobacteria bacterium]|nr:WYL domain-containing protein [Pseudomonadota bacterium]